GRSWRRGAAGWKPDSAGLPGGAKRRRPAPPTRAPRGGEGRAAPRPPPAGASCPPSSERQLDLDEEAAMRARAGRDAPSMRFDRSLGDREAEPRAVGLEREERFEQTRERVGRHAGATVAEHQRGVSVNADDVDEDASRALRAGERIERVLEQIDQYLAQLLAIRVRQHAGAQIERQLDRARIQARA